MSFETTGDASTIQTSAVIAALRETAAPARSNPDANLNLLEYIFESTRLINAAAATLIADALLIEIEQPGAGPQTSPQLSPELPDVDDDDPLGDDSAVI